MSAFLYGVALQFRLDIRSRAMLITCYVVPLLFFAFMGGIFTSINPEARYTLIQSMTVFAVSMGALIGLPPTVVELYGGGVKNVYKANGAPLYLGVVTQVISAFIHLLIMSCVILAVAPVLFQAELPANLPLYFGSLALFTAVSLSLGAVLGLLCKTQSKLTMLSQLLFLPSIMLSGIMFPISMLPGALELAGKLFPASWGYLLMTSAAFSPGCLWPLLVILAAAVCLCVLLLRRLQSE